MAWVFRHHLGPEVEEHRGAILSESLSPYKLLNVVIESVVVGHRHAVPRLDHLLELAPKAFDILGMGASHWVDEVQRMVDGQMLIAGWQICDSSICAPEIRGDRSAGANELLDDRKQRGNVSTLDQLRETSASTLLDASEHPLTMMTWQSTPIVLTLGDRRLVDLDIRARASDHHWVGDKVLDHNVAEKLRPLHSGLDSDPDLVDHLVQGAQLVQVEVGQMENFLGVDLGILEERALLVADGRFRVANAALPLVANPFRGLGASATYLHVVSTSGAGEISMLQASRDEPFVESLIVEAQKLTQLKRLHCLQVVQSVVESHDKLFRQMPR